MYKRSSANLRKPFVVCSLLSILFFNTTTVGFAEKTDAEENKKPLNTVVVTANRYPTSIDETGSAITLIDEDEIVKRRRDTVADLLRTVPGLEVVQTGGIGRTTSVFIRGGESDHTLVLVDGVRVNNNTTGAFSFADLKAENIERIEVLRGPQSVLYGSEAIGGVISITTKKAKEGLEATLSTEGGSFSSQQYVGSLRWGDGDTYSSNTISFIDRDGFSVANSNRGNPEDDSYTNFTVSSSNGTSFIGGGKVDLTLRYSTAEAELDDFQFGVGPVDNLFAEQDTDSFVGSLTVSKPITESVNATLKLGFVDEELRGSDPNVTFNNFAIDNQSKSAGIQFDIDTSEDSVFSIGYNFENREAQNRGNFNEDRNLSSVYVQQQYSVNDVFFLTGGIRYDDVSQFGDRVTYRTTAVYMLPQSGTDFHASYGTGFKAPTFNELFFPNFGNPDLSPETSWGYDIGVRQDVLDEKGTIDVTFFQNSVDNLISFDSTTFLAENIQKASTWGIEAVGTFNLSDCLTSKVSYTFTESKDESTGRLLARRPRHRGTVQFLLNPIENLETSLSYILVNDRIDSDGSKLDNYHLVNVAFAYSVTDQIKPFLRIDNLFDENYEEVNGFGTAGISAYAGVEITI